MTEKLFRIIGRPKLIEDPRFRSNHDRLRNVEALDAIIGSFIAERTLAETLAHFAAAGVTIGPIKETRDLLEDGYVAAREAIVEVPDADMLGGWLPVHGEVPRLSATPGLLARPAPRLGEHSAEVLRPILGQAAFAGLCEAGIVQGPDLPEAG